MCNSAIFYVVMHNIYIGFYILINIIFRKELQFLFLFWGCGDLQNGSCSKKKVAMRRVPAGPHYDRFLKGILRIPRIGYNNIK